MKSANRCSIGLAMMSLIFLSNCRPRSSSSNVASTNEEQYKATLDELVEFVKPAVLTTTMDVHLYHWAPRTSVSKSTDPAQIPSGEELKNNVNFLSSLFEAMTSNSNAMMNGAYFAIDPYSSQEYGGADWLLIQAVLPKNTRFVSFLKLKDFSESLRVRMSTLGCGETSLIAMYPRVNNMCHKLLVDLFRRLDVGVATYGYPTANFGTVCKSTQIRRLAIVIVRPNILDSNRYVGFTKPDVPKSDIHSLNRLLINKMASVAGFNPLWPSQANDTLPPELDRDEWMHDNLWDCGR